MEEPQPVQEEAEMASEQQQVTDDEPDEHEDHQQAVEEAMAPLLQNYHLTDRRDPSSDYDSGLDSDNSFDEWTCPFSVHGMMTDTFLRAKNVKLVSDCEPQ